MIYLMSLHQPLGPSCQGPYHLTAILLRTKPRTQEHLEDRPFQITAATSATLTRPPSPSKHLGHPHPAPQPTSAPFSLLLTGSVWSFLSLFLICLSLTNRQAGNLLSPACRENKPYFLFNSVSFLGRTMELNCNVHSILAFMYL